MKKTALEQLNFNTLLLTVGLAIGGYFCDKIYSEIVSTHDSVRSQAQDISYLKNENASMKEDIMNRPTRQEVENKISSRFGSSR